MGHQIEAVICRSTVLARLINQSESSIALPNDFWLIPRYRFYPSEARYEEEFEQTGAFLTEFRYLTNGLATRLADATNNGEAIVYVETDYFGGVGSQAAVAWRSGSPVFSSQRRPVLSINAALRAVGVERDRRWRIFGGRDEFDVLGLGRFRSFEIQMEDAGWFSGDS